MFTGIIEATSQVKKVIPYFEDHIPEATALRLEFDIPKIGFSSLQVGESIAVNGVCLTLEKHTDEAMLFYVSSETINKTSILDLKIGDIVNLERAMQLGGRFSGHWVQGHIDGIAELTAFERASENKDADQYTMLVKTPTQLWKYCIEKGSVTIDGISLTINRLLPNQIIALQIIPHTFKCTHLNQLFTKINSGEKCLMNIEVDVLSKTIVGHLENLDWSRYVQK